MNVLQYLQLYISDKCCQLLVTGLWFSPGTPVSSTNKTDCHNITEILLKVALNTINQPTNLYFRLQMVIDRIVDKFTSAGIMTQELDHVKLHVTVMNTLFRKDPTGAPIQKQRGKVERESFDAYNIIKVHCLLVTAIFSKTVFGVDLKPNFSVRVISL